MAAPVVQAVSLAANGANATSHTLSFPTGTAVGNLLVAFAVWDSQQVFSYKSNPNIVWPDDWNYLFQNWTSSAPGANYPKGAAYWKVATASDVSAGSVVITSDEAQKSAYVVLRITGQRVGSTPVLWTSFNPQTGGSEDFLSLRFTGWRNGTATVTIASPFTGLQQVNDGDATGGVGIAFAKYTYTGVMHPSGGGWTYTPSGTDGSGRPLPYAVGEALTILAPHTIAEPAPLTVNEVYHQAWPVLKEQSGAFTEDFWERSPLNTSSTEAPDPDYPEVLASESIKTALDSGGRHVLTGDWDTSHPNDWVVTGAALFEIGPEGAAPGNPLAGTGSGASRVPIGGWFNAKECRWTFDQQLVSTLWPEAWGNNYPLTYLYGWSWELDWDAEPSQSASYGYGPVKYSQLYLYYNVGIGGGDWMEISVSPFPMSRAQWEGKRVRFILEWRCGTITWSPPGANYATADDVGNIASDGHIKLSVMDLDTSVTTVVHDLRGIPLVLDGWQGVGEPDINYACGIALGYFSMIGPNERTIVEAWGLPAPPPPASTGIRVWALEVHPTKLSDVEVVAGQVKSGQVVTYRVRATGRQDDPAEGELIEWAVSGAGTLLTAQSRTNATGYATAKVQYGVDETGNSVVEATLAC